MSGGPREPAIPRLLCVKCRRELVPGQVTVSYLGKAFPIELLKCPQCGVAYVSEALATGKMLTVEQALEDK